MWNIAAAPRSFLILAVAAAGLLSATPADAHCYSVWNYPWPQRCGAVRQAYAEIKAPRPARPFTPPPIAVPASDEAARAIAIDQLRRQLNATIQAEEEAR
jgi:hypothetical protein